GRRRPRGQMARKRHLLRPGRREALFQSEIRPGRRRRSAQDGLFRVHAPLDPRLSLQALLSVRRIRHLDSPTPFGSPLPRHVVAFYTDRSCPVLVSRSRDRMAKKSGTYRFSFGPWNISTGADPFGPPVRKEVAFAKKVREYKRLGFDYIQLHDD